VKTLIITLALLIPSAEALAQSTKPIRLAWNKCGLQPLAPLGCNAVCTCSQFGTGCQWTFVCN
jgi:hypothetical protein